MQIYIIYRKTTLKKCFTEAKSQKIEKSNSKNQKESRENNLISDKV